MVPAALRRGAERRDAPAPPGRGAARPPAAARHVRPGGERRRRARRRGRRDAVPRGAPARAAGDHRPSHRGQARHRAGEAPPHLPPARRSRGAALDPARAERSDRRRANGDRAALAHRRAATGEAHRRPGARLGTVLRDGEPVRRRPRLGGQARPRAAAGLSRRTVRSAAVFPVRLVDRRRPRRQSLRHERGDAAERVRQSRRQPASLPAAARRAVAGALRHRARGRDHAGVPGGPRSPDRPERGRRADRRPQPRRGVPAVRRVHAAAPGRHAHVRGAGQDGPGGGGLPHGGRAHRRLAVARIGPRRRARLGRGRAARTPRAARGRGISLQHVPARPAGQHDAPRCRPHRPVARAAPGRLPSPLARVARVGDVAAGRARPAAPTELPAAQPPARGGRDARHVPADPRAAGRARPRGDRQLHPQYDPRRGRRAGRAPARQRSRPVRRRPRHRELHLAGRAAVRIGR